MYGYDSMLTVSREALELVIALPSPFGSLSVLFALVLLSGQ